VGQAQALGRRPCRSSQVPRRRLCGSGSAATLETMWVRLRCHVGDHVGQAQAPGRRPWESGSGARPETMGMYTWSWAGSGTRYAALALAGVGADRRGPGQTGVHGVAGTSLHRTIEGAGGEGGIGSVN
jgi:hypothetical protein